MRVSDTRDLAPGAFFGKCLPENAEGLSIDLQRFDERWATFEEESAKS
jgi:hypothetical protein